MFRLNIKSKMSQDSTVSWGISKINIIEFNPATFYLFYTILSWVHGRLLFNDLEYFGCCFLSFRDWREISNRNSGANSSNENNVNSCKDFSLIQIIFLYKYWGNPKYQAYKGKSYELGVSKQNTWDMSSNDTFFVRQL